MKQNINQMQTTTHRNQSLPGLINRRTKINRKRYETSKSRQLDNFRNASIFLILCLVFGFIAVDIQHGYPGDSTFYFIVAVIISIPAVFHTIKFLKY